MVLVELPDEQVKELMESVDLDRGSELTVDLEALTVTTPAGRCSRSRSTSRPATGS